MKINNKVVQTAIILNLVGLGLFLLLIFIYLIDYGFFLYEEVFCLLITLVSIRLNISLYIGKIKSLYLVGVISIIGSIILFLISFYSYQETPLLLVIIGSSLLLYSEYKNNGYSRKNGESSFDINNSILKRAELFLEEKDFQKTIEYSEKVLDKNPQAGLAYLYKLLAENKVVSLDQYVLSGKPIDNLIKDPLYKRFKQFTPLYILSTVEKPIVSELEKINIINETSHLLKKEDLKDNLEVLETNLVALNRIHPFKNSSTLVYRLEQKISRTKEIISESRYLEALKLIKGNNSHKLKDAFLILNQLKDYKDSIKLIRKIGTKLNELNRLRTLKTIKISSKFALIGIVLAIVFNLTNTLFFKTYTISFVTNGGPNLQPFSLRFNEEVNLPLVQKVGHSFDDWYLDQSLTNLHEVERMPAENITLYAKWSVNQYTITFITNGGDGIQPITQDYGSTLNIPQINKAGYSFGGWYKDEGLTQLYIVPVNMPAESLTLYARWVVNQYTISFVTNGGNVIPVQNNAYGSVISLPSVNKTGHSFRGWFTDSSLSTEFILTTMPSQNLILYAKWLLNQYTITFITNGGDPIQPVTQDYGSPLNIPQINKTGYSLGGWYRDLGLTIFFSIPLTMPSESLILYAKWMVNQYTITFVTNGGSSIANQNNSYGLEILIPDAVRTGYSFVNWYTDLSLNDQFSLLTMPAENITLYAKWSVNQYTITFITNGGDGIQPITQDYGSTLNIPQINKAGYSFGGWYKDEGLTQLYIVPVNMPAESLTLYARWNVELQASNSADGDLFGKSIASYGDYFVVGAPGKNAKNRNSFGTVYLYKFSDRNFERLIVPSLTPSSFISSDYNNLLFGTSVAIEGDFIIIGAPGYDQPYEGQGSVFIYKISDLSYERIIPGGGANHGFGAKVAISDGIIAVGAPNAFGNNTWIGFQNVDNVSGRVYLFKVNDVAYSYSFSPIDIRNGDIFGSSLSFNNGNLLVGAPHKDNNGVNTGTFHGNAYLYSISEAGVTLNRKIIASDISAEDKFGTDLDIFGDYFVIGSPGDDDFGESSGSLYLYKISDPSFSRKITKTDSTTYDLIGTNVSINSDYILDGIFLYSINEVGSIVRVNGTESLNFLSTITSELGSNNILISDYDKNSGILHGIQYSN